MESPPFPWQWCSPEGCIAVFLPPCPLKGHPILGTYAISNQFSLDQLQIWSLYAGCLIHEEALMRSHHPEVLVARLVPLYHYAYLHSRPNLRKSGRTKTSSI